MRVPYWLKAGAIGAAGALVALFAVGLFLGFQGVRFSFSDAVLTALIASVTTVIVALLNRTRQHAKAAREQVENNHSTNLREESDERHTENQTLLKQLALDVGGMRQDMRALTARVDRSDERLFDHIETTQDHPPRKGRH